MTPAETRAAVDAIPLTREEIAARIGVSYGHLNNVISGSRDLSRSASLLLDMLRKEYE